MSRQGVAERPRRREPDRGDQGDTSGRDQGDLVDMATYGAPQTARQIVAAALRKNSRDRSGETAIGRWLTSSETDLAIAEVNHLVDALRRAAPPGQPAGTISGARA